LIQDTEIPTAKCSGALPGLCAALKEIFINPTWNEKVFEVLENKIHPSNNKTGRPGMDLWQIFVLSQVRLCQNISYDELHHIANYDSLMRQIMGIETVHGYEKQEIGYQRIIDNVGLLDDETVKKLNDIIVGFGYGVFKKEAAALRLKTDSFVVESNVHFPTDYNLLWDSEPRTIVSANVYNEAGMLKTKYLHSQGGLAFIQKIDYKYNIRGWLTAINNNSTEFSEGDRFGMRLWYNKKP
jgi:hypothetical protein